MPLSASRDTAQSSSDSDKINISTFPMNSQLETQEQIRRFELLRLAFFALKLRKLEQRLSSEGAQFEDANERKTEQEFQRSLLRHAIFQQVLTLIQLDAREQALQIIEACQK